jgi:hypothetical protein
MALIKLTLGCFGAVGTLALLAVLGPIAEGPTPSV